MGNYKKLGANILLITVGSFASRILSFLLVPLYTSILTTEEYGIADLLSTTVSLLAPIFTIIIGEAMMRFALDQDSDRNQIFTCGLTINILGFLLLLIFSPLLLLFEILSPYYWFFIAYYFTHCIYSAFSYFARGIEEVTVFTICGVINTVCVILLNIVFLLWLKIGLVGYLLAFIISSGISAIFLFFGGKMYQYLITPKQLDKELMKEMIRYSLPMVPNSVSWWVSNSSDKYILTAFAGVSVTGIYSVAYKIPTILSVLCGIFMTAWRMSAVEDFGTEKAQHFYNDVFNKYISMSIIISAGLITFNKVLANFLYAKDFFIAWVFVPVLVIAVMFHGMGEFFGSIYTSAKKTSMLFYSSILGAILNIILNFILIPSLGGMGAAIATLISYGAIWLVRIVHSGTIMKLTFDIWRDMICLILLLIQAMIVCIDGQYAFVLSFVILLIIIGIKLRFLFDSVNMILALLKKRLFAERK